MSQVVCLPMLTEELLAMEHSRVRAAHTSCTWRGSLWLCGRDQGREGNGLSANRSRILTRLRRSVPGDQGDMKYMAGEPGKPYKPVAL